MKTSKTCLPQGMYSLVGGHERISVHFKINAVSHPYRRLCGARALPLLSVVCVFICHMMTMPGLPTFEGLKFHVCKHFKYVFY